ncbi:MAG: hypothetical protein M3Y32_00245 [Pseudomonadota bacterium]|nr:hypothetical protein [Pseudomonadota bacterium]
MSSLWAPLRRAGVAVFKSDLQLRRADSGVRIVLQERWTDPTCPRPQTRAEIEADRERTDLALMKEQLGALLAELPETRQTLRHLVFVEHALHKKGLRALHKLPLDVLEHALSQLEGLVTNWSPTGLASLRSKMAVAIIDREHMDPEADGEAQATSVLLDAELLEQAPQAAVQAAEQAAESEDAALAAAYAALGHAVPAELEFQAELGSPSARAVGRPSTRVSSVDVELDLRELVH